MKFLFCFLNSLIVLCTLFLLQQYVDSVRLRSGISRSSPGRSSSRGRSVGRSSPNNNKSNKSINHKENPSINSVEQKKTENHSKNNEKTDNNNSKNNDKTDHNYVNKEHKENSNMNNNHSTDKKEVQQKEIREYPNSIHDQKEKKDGNVNKINEESNKQQTNLVQTSSNQSSHTTTNPVSATATESNSNGFSGILNSMAGSLAGNVVGNAISEKFFKGEKNENNHAQKNEMNGNTVENHHSDQNLKNGRYLKTNNFADSNFDYYVFSVQNKMISCFMTNKKSSNCQNEEIKWTIHGLWPNSFDGNHPINCSNKENNIDLFSNDLKENLNKYWPTLIGKDNHNFWTHEWKKHGTCANFAELRKNNSKYSSIDDNVLYFDKSLQILDKLRIDNFFNNKYSFNNFDDMTKTISKRYNTEIFDSVCNYDKNSRKQYLKELRFKLDKNFEISNNNSLKKDTNCYRSKPIYIYPERVESNSNKDLTISLNLFRTILILFVIIIF